MQIFFKIILNVIVIFFTITALAVASGGWWLYQQFNKPSVIEQSIIITIKRGENINDIANKLNKLNVIESPYTFRIAGRIYGQAHKLKAGEFEIPANSSIKQILDILEEGKTVKRKITIREGLTSYEIITLLSGIESLEKSDIEIPKEGSLLPETYIYTKGDSIKDIITRMQRALDKAIDELWEQRAENLPLKNKKEAIILASIIEKETALPSERARIAGVFINRLRKGMLLQTDPTVIYAITNGRHEDKGKGPLGRKLLRKDLKFDSPYNTYLYTGLPPTPISNPGYESIKAALNPEEHEYLYFVADGKGGHAFAKTLKEHNKNVMKWRKIKQNQ